MNKPAPKDENDEQPPVNWFAAAFFGSILCCFAKK